MAWNFYTSGGVPVAGIGLPGGIKYFYSTSTSDADPGGGFIRTNNATVASTTQVFIDNLDAEGVTQTGWYETFDDSTTSPRGYLYIQTSGSTALILAVTSVTAASGYYKLGCTYVSGQRPANDAMVSVMYNPSGPPGSFSNNQTIETKGLDYTLVSTDAGKVILCTSDNPRTISVNLTTGFETGQRIDIIQTGTGQVSFAGNSATLVGTPGLKLRARYSAASILCTSNSSDEYIVMGDLTN